MSDFDKEAERRKLREKYERDKEKRKATQQMSELLLKGATMTNRHCDDCGDPIFRYDGQEFCPTCQNAQVAGSGGGQAGADATDVEGDGAESLEGDGAEPPEGDGAEPPEGDVTVQTPDETGDGAGGARSGQAAQPTAAEAASEQAAETAGEQTTEAAKGRTARSPQGDVQQPGRTAQPPAAGAGDADLEDARAALRRSIVRYARAGENADGPRRATELFAAAREAAETLAALDR